jgi:hypothetical protein
MGKLRRPASVFEYRTTDACRAEDTTLPVIVAPFPVPALTTIILT